VRENQRKRELETEMEDEREERKEALMAIRRIQRVMSYE
jgi:hypothetical protein